MLPFPLPRGLIYRWDVCIGQFICCWSIPIASVSVGWSTVDWRERWRCWWWCSGEWPSYELHCLWGKRLDRVGNAGQTFLVERKHTSYCTRLDMDIDVESGDGEHWGWRWLSRWWGWMSGIFEGDFVGWCEMTDVLCDFSYTDIKTLDCMFPPFS